MEKNRHLTDRNCLQHCLQYPRKSGWQSPIAISSFSATVLLNYKVSPVGCIFCLSPQRVSLTHLCGKEEENCKCTKSLLFSIHAAAPPGRNTDRGSWRSGSALHLLRTESCHVDVHRDGYPNCHQKNQEKPSRLHWHSLPLFPPQLTLPRWWSLVCYEFKTRMKPKLK